MTRSLQARAGWACLAALGVSLPLLLGQSCFGPADLLSGGTGSGATVEVTAPALNRSIIAGEQITIIYSVNSSGAVSAFYDTDGKGTGKVTFSTGLPGGQNRFVQLPTGTLGGMTLHLGVTVSDAGGDVTAYAPGVITVGQQMAITVASPASDVVFNPGGKVTLKFSSSSSASFSYTAFYDQDQVSNNNETTISSGTGSAGKIISVECDTAGMAPGTYWLGVKVREGTTAGREGVAYASGSLTLEPGAFVSVVSVGGGQDAPTPITAAPGVPIEIVVLAGVPGSTSAVVDVFYDTGTSYSGSEPLIQGGLSLGQTTLNWDTYTVAPGTYYVGAVLRLTPDSPPEKISYSKATVTLEGSASGGGSRSLVLFTPPVDTTAFAGETYQIRWATGATNLDGTLTLLRDPDGNNDGRPDDDPDRSADKWTVIKTGIDPRLRSYDWSTAGLSGRYFLRARLDLNDQTVVYSKPSAGRLTIRSPYFWVGDVDTNKIPGTVLRGFNFQDHAGSGFSKLGDVDEDTVDDFLVLAQYGKPGLINPQGVGEGEAYLIYGNRQRLTGVYDLNRTGMYPGTQPRDPTLPPDPTAPPPRAATKTDGIDQGVLFTGITVRPGSTNTTGITAATWAPDMDKSFESQFYEDRLGDQRNELVFGIAKADSLSLWKQAATTRYEGWLEDDGQFLRGGIVIVSSMNPMITQRWAVSREGNRVIRLQEVGQVFPWVQTDITCCDPACLGWPPLGQAFEDTNSDGDCDSYDYSSWTHLTKGFTQPTDLGLTPINPPLATPFPLCPAYYAPRVTGMFTDTPDEEPYGARILGQALEDGTPPDTRFGFSVGAIRNYSGPNFLLISAPNQTAKRSEIPELAADRPNCGMVYQLITTDYWDTADEMPQSVSRPHQYIIRSAGYFTAWAAPIGSAKDVIRRPISIVGPAADAHISTVAAIPDFNGDGMDDIVVGSPNEGAGGEGAVYIIFRRLLEGEGNYLLDKLALDPADPQRLNGVVIRGDAGCAMGETFAGQGDFNGDGQPDLLIGIPNYTAYPNDADKQRVGCGAVLIVFARQDLVSPVGGFSIDDLVGQGYAALIIGSEAGDHFGFNAASVGDFDGDGKDDVAIAAPGASPHCCADAQGNLQNGLDLDGNGVPDDLNNDGQSDDLTAAGIVYLVYSSNSLMGTTDLKEKSFGSADLRGLAFVGRQAYENLGGGTDSLGLGVRSHGLAAAGDVDSDGRADLLIGAMLADPKGKTNGGEVYLISGGFRP